MESMKETEQLVRDLNRILKLTWFYSPSHPAVRDTLQKIAAQLQTIIPAEGYLLFNISGENLYLGAIPLSMKDENVRGFVRQLKKRRINSILFYSGVSLQELEEFIQVLSLDVKLLRNQGGIKPALASREITHIDVTEYQYQPGSPGSGTTEDEPDTFTMLEATPDRIANIIQYLQGTIPELDTVEMQLLTEFMNDPMRIAELQAQTVQQTVQLEGSASVSRLAELTRNVINRIQNFIENCPEEEKNRLHRKLALSLLHQDPTVALHTITTGKHVDKTQLDAVKQILNKLDDSELINLITASESEQHAQLEEISSLFYQLPLDGERTERLINKYMDLLIKRRQLEEDELQFTKLQQELNQYPTYRMLTQSVIILLEMLEKETDKESFFQLLQALQTGVNQLFEARQYTCLYDVYRTIHRLMQSVQLGDFSEEKQQLQQKLHDFYTWLIDPQKINQLLTALETVSTQPFQPVPGQYPLSPEKSSDISGLENQQIILELLTLIGTPAIPGIVDRLNKIGIGHTIYQPLQMLLVRFGDSSVPYLESSVHLDSERVQEHIIFIIGKIATQRAQTAIINLLPRLHPAVRKQAIYMISQFSNQQSFAWLVDRFNNEKDPELRLTALDGIANLNNDEAIKFLITYAGQRKTNKKNRSFQLRAIQLLGKHKIEQAVPTLIKLFQQKHWLFAQQYDLLRIEVARALAFIGTEEAKATIRSGCKDKRTAVRTVCETLEKQL